MRADKPMVTAEYMLYSAKAKVEQQLETATVNAELGEQSSIETTEDENDEQEIKESDITWYKPQALVFSDTDFIKYIYNVSKKRKPTAASQITSDKVEYKFHDTIIDVTELMNIYSKGEDYKEGSLHKDKNNFIDTCINFMYTQMNMNIGITAGMIGNMCGEGVFAEQQHTYKIAQSLDEYVEWLDRHDSRGYGIVQWTTQSRQDKLKKRLYEVVNYFKKAYNYSEKELTSGKLFPMVVIIGELTYMYDELIEYKVFTSFDAKYGYEDATGRIAVIFEGYNGSKSQFQKWDGTYHFTGGSKTTGAERMNYAEIAYNKLKELGK